MSQQASLFALGFILFNLKFKKSDVTWASLAGTLYHSIFMILFTFHPIDEFLQSIIQVLGTYVVNVLVLIIRLDVQHILISLLLPYGVAGNTVVLGTFFLSMFIKDIHVFFIVFKFFQEPGVIITMLASIGITVGLIIVCQITHFIIYDLGDEENVLKLQKRLNDFYHDTRTR
jgi:hypothetical protein